jgi:HD-like signal output (HDOD) protein
VYDGRVNKIDAFGTIAAQAARGEITLPTSVNAALRLQLALDNPDCHIEDAIKLVLGEPQLAARVVALANSVAFARDGMGAVTGVRAAVMRVGYRSLQNLAAALVVRQFGSRITDPVLRAKAEQLWQHTAHVAALAQVLARRVTGVDPDTAMFAGIVHEVGAFYLISRADEFPGLLDDDPEKWAELCEEVVTREVLRKLAIPEPVAGAIIGARDGMLGMPPATLQDTLVLANQFAQVTSPLGSTAPLPSHADSALDFVIDAATLASILKQADDDLQAMSAALMV